MKMTVATGGTIEDQMTWMMVFGITTWLLDSMVGIALSISDDEVMYARSLRLTRWQTMREVLIKGKAADIFGAIIVNFAMAWMLLASIENIAKASGGIGVVLADSNKYWKFDQVYAIQLLILLTGIGMDWLLRKVKIFLFPYSK
jgi:NitT/TauT family transport system permease protein